MGGGGLVLQRGANRPCYEDPPICCQPLFFQILASFGGVGVHNFLLEKRGKPEKGGLM